MPVCALSPLPYPAVVDRLTAIGIPIIKLSLQPSPSIPFGIACDIGFENRLALENTRLLFTYAAIDPTRVRTLVLFCEYAAS